MDAKRRSTIVTLGPLAAPLASLYGAGVLLRRFAYDRGLVAVSLPPVFTVSVGGLEAGGSGKTPVAGLLLAALERAGRKPGLLTRGYGRKSSGLVYRAPGELVDPASIGDEPAMLVDAGLDVPVVACARRAEGAGRLVEVGCTSLVLDDAFAHRAQGRDLDIVVLRAEEPFGNGHLLPWGSLREPPSSLRRAHVVWLHHRTGVSIMGPHPGTVQRFSPEATRVSSEAVAHGPFDAGGEAVDMTGARVVAAAGIARPADFFRSVEAGGGDVACRMSFSDHHDYTAADVATIARAAERSKADAVVVTPKDAVKLRPLWSGVPLWVLGTRVIVRRGVRDLAARLGVEAADIDCGP